MSIPYNPQLSLETYHSNTNWYQSLPAPSLLNSENQVTRAVNELFAQAFKQSFVREQFLRDTARLVLKVPIRAIVKPIFLEKNWQERERAKVNAKLTGYSFVQLASVPVKFSVALIALMTAAASQERAKKVLDASEKWTTHLDGRCSQLEALKEEGAKKAQSWDEFVQYRTWLFNIDPRLCRK